MVHQLVGCWELAKDYWKDKSKVKILDVDWADEWVAWKDGKKEKTASMKAVWMVSLKVVMKVVEWADVWAAWKVCVQVVAMVASLAVWSDSYVAAMWVDLMVVYLARVRDC